MDKRQWEVLKRYPARSAKPGEEVNIDIAAPAKGGKVVKRRAGYSGSHTIQI